MPLPLPVPAMTTLSPLGVKVTPQGMKLPMRLSPKLSDAATPPFSRS